MTLEEAKARIERLHAEARGYLSGPEPWGHYAPDGEMERAVWRLDGTFTDEDLEAMLIVMKASV